jgi:hypothetical protein
LAIALISNHIHLIAIPRMADGTTLALRSKTSVVSGMPRPACLFQTKLDLRSGF